MKSRRLKPLLALLLVLGLGLVFAVTPAATATHVLDWRVLGTGTATGSCQDALAGGCSSNSAGSVLVLGTHTGNSGYTLNLTAGPGPAQLNSAGGSCFS